MNVLKDINTPQEINLLVGFFDLTRFLRFSEDQPNQHIFDFLSAYFEFVGDIVEDAGGTVIKFLGDAGLIIFPEDEVSRGVLALQKLRESGDAWLADHEVPSRNIVSAHFGPVVCGPLGTRNNKQFDIIGKTVNVAVTLKSNGLVITPQVFRKLDPDTRKLFKKHTPPISYIPVDDRHRD